MGHCNQTLLAEQSLQERLTAEQVRHSPGTAQLAGYSFELAGLPAGPAWPVVPGEPVELAGPGEPVGLAVPAEPSWPEAAASAASAAFAAFAVIATAVAGPDWSGQRPAGLHAALFAGEHGPAGAAGPAWPASAAFA